MKLAILALLTGAVLAGCGSDEETTATAPEPGEGPLITYSRFGGIVFTVLLRTRLRGRHRARVRRVPGAAAGARALLTQLGGIVDSHVPPEATGA